MRRSNRITLETKLQELSQSWQTQVWVAFILLTTNKNKEDCLFCLLDLLCLDSNHELTLSVAATQKPTHATAYKLIPVYAAHHVVPTNNYRVKHVITYLYRQYHYIYILYIHTVVKFIFNFSGFWAGFSNGRFQLEFNIQWWSTWLHSQEKLLQTDTTFFLPCAWWFLSQPFYIHVIIR